MRNYIKQIWMMVRIHVLTIQAFEMKKGCFLDVLKILVSDILFLDLEDGVETFPGLSLLVEKGGIPIPCFKPQASGL